MRMMWVAITVLIALALFPSVQATYLNINSAADINDTAISFWTSADVNKNWGAHPFSYTSGIGTFSGSGGYYSNTLINFNYTKYTNISTENNITSANISIWHNGPCGGSTGNSRTIDMYFMEVGWIEGPGNTDGGELYNASWAGNDTGRWKGGLFSSLNYNTTKIATQTIVCGTAGRYTFTLNDVGLSLLNRVARGNVTNNGFVLNLSTAMSGADAYSIIFKENATAFYTPRMELTYENATSSPIIVTITSPANTTYVGITTLPLVYHVTNIGSCTWSAYSLDGAVNITLECLNGTITDLSSGSHTIQVWVMNGTAPYTDTEHFTMSYAAYTLNITDELTYNALYNGTKPGVVFNTSVTKLYVYCAASTETTTITSNPMNVSIGCAFEEMRLEMKDANGTHWRTMYPTAYNGTLEFIMVNETATDVIEQTWEMYDVTGDYTNGFLKVTKAIGSYGIKTIEEKRIDASGNAVLYLIPGERYCFSVLNAVMTSERNLGCLYATTETSTRTEISRVPYAPDIDLTYKDVLAYFTWDKSGAYIQGIYNDTAGLTSSVNFTVYNATNPAQIMFTSVSTFNYVVFTYNAVNTNGTYIAVITAINSKYGTLVEKRTIGFYATGQEKPSLPSGYEWLLAASGGLISIFMMLAFGRKNQNIGIGVSVLFILLFMYWGWFDSAPMLGWSFLTLITFIAVIGFFIRRDNA